MQNALAVLGQKAVKLTAMQNHQQAFAEHRITAALARPTEHQRDRLQAG